MTAATFCLLVGHSGIALADQSPDATPPHLSPDFIGCMMAVDDAEFAYLSQLQNKCFSATMALCGGYDANTPLETIIGCIRRETDRGMDFLDAALSAVPESVNGGGFHPQVYQNRRTGILEELEALRNSPAPGTVETALRQAAIMAANTSLILNLARETETPMESVVEAKSDLKQPTSP
jgi:hypothetical protein